MFRRCFVAPLLVPIHSLLVLAVGFLGGRQLVPSSSFVAFRLLCLPAALVTPQKSPRRVLYYRRLLICRCHFQIRLLACSVPCWCVCISRRFFVHPCAPCGAWFSFCAFLRVLVALVFRLLFLLCFPVWR